MIQCIGSRNEEHPYCSRICCSEAIKNAIKIKEISPDSDVIILYRDIRTYGLKEKYYGLAREKGIIFIRFDENNPPSVNSQKVKGGKESLKIIVQNSGANTLEIDADLLILSSGIVAPVTNADLAPKLKVPLNDDNFFLEAHMKLRPVDFATAGIFVCGMAHAPKTIEESIAQANATVSRACTILSKDTIEAEGIVAFINPGRCTGCGLCVLNCPYKAIEIDKAKLVAVVNQALCMGCGTCSANCRCSAIDLLGFTNEQIALIINSRGKK